MGVIQDMYLDGTHKGRDAFSEKGGVRRGESFIIVVKMGPNSN
jgi:hypothetical protein